MADRSPARSLVSSKTPRRCGHALRGLAATGLLVTLAIVGLVAPPPLVADLHDAAGASESGSVVPLLWRVDASDGNGHEDGGRIYLYGSIHVAPPEVIPPPPIVRTAFTRSDVLVTEVLLDDVVEEVVASELLAHSRLPAGTGLRDLFSDEEWTRVRGWAREWGIELAAIEGFQPWAVELLVVQAEGADEGFDAANGLDLYFAAKASARAIEQRGLESVAEQMDALAGAPLAEQARSLLASIDGSTQASVRALYDAWRSGDAAALEALVRGQYGDGADVLYERLFTTRNRAWAERLAGLLDEGRTAFVVVGAGHLVGGENVLDLLRSRGYRVRRVRSFDEL